ncbi:hypothetical protein BRADI_3g30580v3, partial [Brachypodium distachyon]
IPLLPLVRCPCCRVRSAVCLVSKPEQNPDRVFYKCPNHRNGKGGCNFFHWEDGEDSYVDYLSSIGVVIPCIDSAGEIEEQEHKVEQKAMKNVEKKVEKVEKKDEMQQILEKIEDLIGLCKMTLCVLWC